MHSIRASALRHLALRHLAVALLLAFPAAASAEYEAYDVEDGGTIRGRVRLRGDVPATAAVEVQKDVSVCGHQVEDRSLLVGEGGAVRNVVVFLSDIESGKPIDLQAEPTLDNRACRFEPHVQSLSVGQHLNITNSDPVLHNTHSYVLEGGKGNRFNLALAHQGRSIRKAIKRPGVHQVKCDAGHTWMSAFFLVFEHPYHVVTGADGAFTLDGVPPGEHTLSVWHEVLGRSATTVRVEAGKTAVVPEIVYDASRVEN
jgi:plastocyanin